MRIFQPTVTGSNTTTGSLHISGPVHFYTLDDTTVSYVLTYNTESGQVYYTASSQVGTPTNPAPEDTYIQYNSGSEFGATGSFRFIYTSQSFQHGENNNTYSNYSHVEGYNNTITEGGIWGHAEGHSNYVSNFADHAEGYYNSASGQGSHAEGQYTKALAPGSHTEGKNTTTLFQSQYFHAEGISTTTFGLFSHAEGSGSMTIGDASHAAGLQTTTSGNYQSVIGQYNKTLLSQSAFIIGDGTADNARHNVLFVSKSHFEISASNTYLQGLPEISSNYILTYNSESGQVYYALSTALETSPFPFSGSAIITGSLLVSQSGITVTGSMFVSGAISASFGSNTVGFFGTVSWAQSASFAATAAAAPLDTYIQYNKNGVLGAEQHFRYVYTSHSLQNGFQTTASGQYSHAEGFNTIATGSYQTVVGQYNVALPSQSAFIIGDGYIAPLETEKLTSFIAAGTDNLSESFSFTPAVGMFIILTDVSTGISETFEITKVTNIGGGNFNIEFNGNTTQTYNNLANDTYSLATYRRHNLLFASRSWFEVSASNVFFKGLPKTSQSNILVYDTSSGQVYYTSSNVAITPTFPYTGSAGITGSLILTGSIFVSGAISASFGENTVGFYGTASWAQSSSQAISSSYTLTASYALTAAAAPEDTYIQYNKNGLFGATGSFRFIYTSESLQQGNEVTASGYWSHAQGSASIALGIGSHAEGYLTSASGDYSHAEGGVDKGQNTKAFGVYSHAEGLGNESHGTGSHAEGRSTYAYGEASHTEGDSAEAHGIYSHAEGRATNAYGTASHAEGWFTSASGDYSHTEGYYTIASGSYSHAEGWKTETYSTASHTEGWETKAYGTASHAEGYRTTASGDYSHAEGGVGRASIRKTIALGKYSHAEGLASTSEGEGSHAEGFNTYAFGETSHTEGYFTSTSGDYSHAEGSSTYASGSASHAEGRDTITIGNFSHAEGWITSASGDYSHAEGVQTITSGSGSHAEGYQTATYADYSHAEGYKTITRFGTYSYAHAEGYETVADGNAAHSEGYQTTASGAYTHAEGSQTKALNTGAHSEGLQTTASGVYSHAEGSNSEAFAEASHAAGLYTIANGSYQSVIGQYNVSLPSRSAFIIGDGTANNNRHNVLFVSKSHFEVSASNTYLQGLPETSSLAGGLTYEPSTGQVRYAPEPYKTYVATFTAENGSSLIRKTVLQNILGVDLDFENFGPDTYLLITSPSSVFTSTKTIINVTLTGTGISSTSIRNAVIRRNSATSIRIFPFDSTSTLNFDIGADPATAYFGSIEIRVYS